MGELHADIITQLIGIGEILMAAWIVSGYKRKINIAVQITVITAMNIIEFVLVPQMLLWGRCNIIFAGILVILLFYQASLVPSKTAGR